MICSWTWVPEDTSTQATSAYIKCKQWICRKVRMVKTTVLFIWDQVLTGLIHLNFITLILICFKLMMPGLNYVIYGCSSARTTRVSLQWSFTIWKGKLKTELCALLDYFYQPKFFNILAIGQRYFSFHVLCSI